MGGPRRAQGRQHAHGPNHLAIAKRRVGEGVAAQLAVLRLAHGRADGPLLQQGEADQHHAADQRQHADRRVDEEQGDHEDRNPGDVEKGRRRHAGQGRAELVEVAQGLGPRAGVAAHRGVEQGRKHLARHPLVQQDAVVDQDPGAKIIDDAEDGESEQRDHRQHDQGGNVLVHQHAAVDLVGVERHREVKQVRDEAERRRHRERVLSLGQGARQHIVRLVR